MLGTNASQKEGPGSLFPSFPFASSLPIPEQRLHASISLRHGAYRVQTLPFEAGRLLSRSLISCPSHYDCQASYPLTTIQSMVTKHISIRSSHSKSHMSCESRIVNLGQSGWQR